MDDRAIGIFDSGLGGLTAMRAIREELPNENIIYFGDTARMPYGARPAEMLRRMARQDLDFLTAQGVKCILAACGTVSSTAPDVLASHPVRTFNVLEPTLREAARRTDGPIGVIATAASIRSGAFQRGIERLCPHAEIIPVACPAFVPLIESGHYDPEDPELKAAVAEYLAPIRSRGARSLVLGCTHYGLVAEAIRRFLGEEVPLIEASRCAASALSAYLRENDLCGGTGEESFLTSGSDEEFRALSTVFLARAPRGEVRHVPAIEV